jgi:hypothetical protein
MTSLLEAAVRQWRELGLVGRNRHREDHKKIEEKNEKKKGSTTTGITQHDIIKQHYQERTSIDKTTKSSAIVFNPKKKTTFELLVKIYKNYQKTRNRQEAEKSLTRYPIRRPMYFSCQNRPFTGQK